MGGGGDGEDGDCEVMVDTPPPRPGIFPYSVPAQGRPRPSRPSRPFLPSAPSASPAGCGSPARRLPGCARRGRGQRRRRGRRPPELNVHNTGLEGLRQQKVLTLAEEEPWAAAATSGDGGGGAGERRPEAIDSAIPTATRPGGGVI